jgi:hypothetical protein
MVAKQIKNIYWHRELPPRAAEAVGEHTVEAVSQRVRSRMAHGDVLWRQCYEDLMARAQIRLEEELARLGGDYAHVLNEFVDSRHDDASGESWLHGQFTYMLYRKGKTQRSPLRKHSS